MQELKNFENSLTLTLLHSERPKLHTVLSVLSAIGLSQNKILKMNYTFKKSDENISGMWWQASRNQ